MIKIWRERVQTSWVSISVQDKRFVINVLSRSHSNDSYGDVMKNTLIL